MDQRYFITKSQLTPKIALTVVEGETINLEGETYLEISKKPRGKSVIKTLRKLEDDSQIIIYK